MDFLSGAQLIVSSNLIEIDSNEESKPIENYRKSTSPRRTKASINNMELAMPWRTLSVASSVGAVSEEESDLPRFSIRSIKKTQNDEQGWKINLKY